MSCCCKHNLSFEEIHQIMYLTLKEWKYCNKAEVWRKEGFEQDYYSLHDAYHAQLDHEKKT